MSLDQALLGTYCPLLTRRPRVCCTSTIAKISVFCVIFPCQITNWIAFISWLCLDARRTRWTSSGPATEKKRQASIISLIISNLFLPSCLALLSFNCIVLILGTMQTWSAAATEKIEQVPDLELYLLLLTPIMDLFSIPDPKWGPFRRPGTLSPPANPNHGPFFQSLILNEDLWWDLELYLLLLTPIMDLFFNPSSCMGTFDETWNFISSC